MSGVVKVFPVKSLSFVRKSTRKKREQHARMMKWDPKSRDRPIVGPDWASASAPQLAKASRCESSCELFSDGTRDCSIDRMHRPATERSPTSGPVRRGDGHETWDPISSSGSAVLVSSRSIFSPVKEN